MHTYVIKCLYLFIMFFFLMYICIGIIAWRDWTSCRLGSGLPLQGGVSMDLFEKVYIYVYTCNPIYICIYIYVSTRKAKVYTYVYTCTPRYIYVYTCNPIYICIYIYVCIYTQTQGIYIFVYMYSQIHVTYIYV